MTDVSGFFVDFLLGVFLPPAAAGVYQLIPWGRVQFTTEWIVVAAADTVIGLISWQPGYATGGAVSLLVALIIRWFNRRRRDRAAKFIGAKSRAIRDALVRRMRELAPRPVLQPVPHGAPA